MNIEKILREKNPETLRDFIDDVRSAKSADLYSLIAKTTNDLDILSNFWDSQNLDIYETIISNPNASIRLLKDVTLYGCGLKVDLCLMVLKHPNIDEALALDCLYYYQQKKMVYFYNRAMEIIIENEKLMKNVILNFKCKGVIPQ
jgi:hypothetical protein